MKAVIYARVSTDKDAQQSSLVRQKEELIEAAAKQGIEAAAVFEEQASGYEIDRPELLDMLEFIKKEGVRVVYIQDETRLGRGHARMALIHQLHKLNCRIHTLQDHGELQVSETDTMVLDIVSIVEEYQRKLHNAKIKRGMKKAVEKGYEPHRHLLRGNGGRNREDVPIDEVEKLKRQGMTFRDITVMLQGLGYNVSRATIHRRYKEYQAEQLKSADTSGMIDTSNL
ncbi:YneB family resolvase-like protein [Alkalicoccus chagannorensis]|uniref:YneB family resolvase-like protein n=1 Tax=Alkalicoccus chagannorensis TaxID=427072 RepID=UPI0004787B05|nr:recombinase family protein [Alkalicoccus chagannorensis]